VNITKLQRFNDEMSPVESSGTLLCKWESK